jgi:hypothetical protein
MIDINRNNELKYFINNIVEERLYKNKSYIFDTDLLGKDVYKNLVSSDKLKILTLYESENSETRDTMCTDFCNDQAKLIIKILDGSATSADTESLIDELYMNIEHHIKEIIENQVQLKVESYADNYDE